MNIPQKLLIGDEIHIVAPSRSASILSEEGIVQAKEGLEKLGLKVIFGEHIFESDLQNSASIEHVVRGLIKLLREERNFSSKAKIFKSVYER